MMSLLYAGIVLLSILTDRLVKAWAAGPLNAGGRSIDLIPGVFRFTYVENRGAAFGILEQQRWVFIVLTVVVCLYFIYKLFIAKKKLQGFAGIALALILGGAIGNLIDRVFYGYVVDIFDFHLINFAVFNVADSCVVVGVILLLVWILFFESRHAGAKE